MRLIILDSDIINPLVYGIDMLFIASLLFFVMINNENVFAWLCIPMIFLNIWAFVPIIPVKGKQEEFIPVMGSII